MSNKPEKYRRITRYGMTGLGSRTEITPEYRAAEKKKYNFHRNLAALVFSGVVIAVFSNYGSEIGALTMKVLNNIIGVSEVTATSGTEFLNFVRNDNDLVPGASFDEIATSPQGQELPGLFTDGVDSDNFISNWLTNATSPYTP